MLGDTCLASVGNALFDNMQEVYSYLKSLTGGIDLKMDKKKPSLKIIKIADISTSIEFSIQ